MAAAMVAMIGSCLSPRFACSKDSQCDTDRGGRCEADGACSFADLECCSGRRYGSIGDVSHADQCVPGECNADDAGSDGGESAGSSATTTITTTAAGADASSGSSGDDGSTSNGSDASTSSSGSSGSVEECDGEDNDGDGFVDENLDECRGCKLRTYETHTYYLCSTSEGTIGLDWAEARARCEGYGDEGGLIMIADEDEQAFLAAEMDPDVYDDLWGGANDFETEDVWVWNDGTSADKDDSSVFTGWKSNEPNSANDPAIEEDCLEFEGETDPPGGWNDDSCEKAKGYVCEVLD
jgi:hypothetical protein